MTLALFINDASIFATLTSRRLSVLTHPRRQLKWLIVAGAWCMCHLLSGCWCVVGKPAHRQIFPVCHLAL